MNVTDTAEEESGEREEREREREGWMEILRRPPPRRRYYLRSFVRKNTANESALIRVVSTLLLALYHPTLAAGSLSRYSRENEFPACLQWYIIACARRAMSRANTFYPLARSSRYLMAIFFSLSVLFSLLGKLIQLRREDWKFPAKVLVRLKSNLLWVL